MKRIKIVSILAVLFITLFSFNAFAMGKEYREPERPSPLNEELGKGWTWLSDDTCAQFKMSEDIKISNIKRMFDLGMVRGWQGIQNRDTYSGKWSQSSEGIWSFEFDDKTIPVGVTKIDGVLYAFTGYGELKADYEYYDGLKTGADGLVTADSAEFKDWLATQYLPECTSHE
ncbi:hypothetical protein [Lacrimispora indolis]|uniref:hypothetical protein n=1 Tax=Lacrimispora indolis TaxID=69825 RepID=UPI00045E731E|nr:hypothetical protein [Lacrimispora indolis]